MAQLNQLNQVQFGKHFSFILPPLASQNYLLQSISVKLKYPFLDLIYLLFFLFFRCREKDFQEDRNKKKGWKQSRFYNMLVSVERDRDAEILDFDLVFVGQNNTVFNAIFCHTCCFQNVNFQEFNLCNYINFELSSAFLYALCESLEKYAVLCGNNRSSRQEVFC